MVDVAGIPKSVRDAGDGKSDRARDGRYAPTSKLCTIEKLVAGNQLPAYL